MSRRWPIVGLLLAALLGLSSGCVDRRFIIESDPPGAIVYENGRQVGATPMDQPFTYYGTYRFVFMRDGYETLTVDECISTPWWEYPGLDFVVENLLPFTVRDVRTIRKPLQPMVLVPPEEILLRADPLRARGLTLGVPLPPPEVAPMPAVLPK